MGMSMKNDFLFMGKFLLNKHLHADYLEVEHSVEDLPAGVYFVRMVADSFGEVGEFEQVKRMVVFD